MARTKIKAAAKFGARYGSVVRKKYAAVELKQRVKQQCPHCKKYAAKRVAKGLWHCKACGKRFTGHAYFLK